MDPRADPERTDAQLVRAVSRGDERAFAALYTRHKDWAYRLAWRFTRDDQLAQDVTQETFTYFLSRFPGFRLSAQLRTYLYPVVRSIAITHLRKIKPERLASDDVLRVEARASHEPGLTAALVAAINDLPPAQREILLMRIVDELPVRAIATALLIPEGTVKSRLHHALRTLRADPALRSLMGEPAPTTATTTTDQPRKHT